MNGMRISTQASITVLTVDESGNTSIPIQQPGWPLGTIDSNDQGFSRRSQVPRFLMFSWPGWECDCVLRRRTPIVLMPCLHCPRTDVYHDRRMNRESCVKENEAIGCHFLSLLSPS
jgi:hypothetical protein